VEGRQRPRPRQYARCVSEDGAAKVIHVGTADDAAADVTAAWSGRRHRKPAAASGSPPVMTTSPQAGSHPLRCPSGRQSQLYGRPDATCAGSTTCAGPTGICVGMWHVCTIIQALT
jgi:hypothetical protein